MMDEFTELQNGTDQLWKEKALNFNNNINKQNTH
jgi:hypothetical protein